MTMDPDDHFAQQLRLKREELGLSQADLAAQLSIESDLSFQGSTIYKIEKGNRKVSVSEAVAIASALRTSLTEMLNVGAGSDAARVAKDVLMDFGISALVEIDEAGVKLLRVAHQQERMRQVIANYRDLFGADPQWLQVPKRPSLREFWEPFVEWDGPQDFIASWRTFMAARGDGYASFIDFDPGFWSAGHRSSESS